MPIKDKTGKSLTIQLPSLIGTKKFTASGLMIKTLCAYLIGLSNSSNLSTLQILEELGCSKQNWYNWQRKEGFVEWWIKTIKDYHTTIGLSQVHSAVLRRAVGNSPQDAKTFLERFDPEYKPATTREHTFAGIMPPESVPGGIDGAVERSKANAERFKPEDQAAPEPVEADPEVKPVQSSQRDSEDSPLLPTEEQSAGKPMSDNQTGSGDGAISKE